MNEKDILEHLPHIGGFAGILVLAVGAFFKFTLPAIITHKDSQRERIEYRNGGRDGIISSLATANTILRDIAENTRRTNGSIAIVLERQGVLQKGIDEIKQQRKE